MAVTTGPSGTRKEDAAKCAREEDGAAMKQGEPGRRTEKNAR